MIGIRCCRRLSILGITNNRCCSDVEVEEYVLKILYAGEPDGEFTSHDISSLECLLIS
jgi:hypothetical protein